MSPFIVPDANFAEIKPDVVCKANFAAIKPDVAPKANFAMIEPSDVKEQNTQIDHPKVTPVARPKVKLKNKSVSKFYSSLGDFHSFSNFKGGFIAARVVNL